MVGQSLEKGIRLFEEKQFEAAKVELKSFLKTQPNNTKAIEYLGDISFREQQWHTAAAYFKPLMKSDKDNAMYHFKYAGAIGMEAKNNKLKALFLIDDIKYHFKQAALLDAKFVDVRLALVQLYTQLPSALGGSEKVAFKYAEQLRNLDVNAYNKAISIIEKEG